MPRTALASSGLACESPLYLRLASVAQSLVVCKLLCEASGMSKAKLTRRTHCPISYALDVFGDKWTLLIVRDLMFKGKRYYREFAESEEGIATNVLADRLSRLEAEGLVTRSVDPDNARRRTYELTDE